MAKRPQLKLNQRVRIKIEDGPYKGEYGSKILDFDDKTIEIELPFDEDNRPLSIKKKTPLKIIFTGATALYQMESKVKKRKKKPVYSLVVLNSSEVERIQRRRFVRISVQEEIEYRVVAYCDIKEKQEYNDYSEEFNKALAADISGGGLMIVIKGANNFEIGQVLELKIDFIELSISLLNGEIVRVEERKEDGTDKITTVYGVKFVDISTELREEIIEWVFAKQRELRKKGLI
ncbi:c-di-GMP-binding flagellar brake protein YcgR [Orenia metallireducens]|uniref:C-di-GMP-binding flagellar brake protein YcgR, contains PilZNR and PilZ domains n=1 Tax=Orenia metallireducens TaxID=1413210 RepID=A0A285FNG4_9FIRM|nr:flagellar brake domain-containing protein [Orenia metallireducens]PRX33653.1 c-di-GMP-binding flagellar brake protein YcgR [Orenia metallireducens]SNY12847.1 c-di-GMP-binding flagellar brake protein YcgR, contains PilZNR and PilZ domains [Orenia metallireducens]